MILLDRFFWISLQRCQKEPSSLRTGGIWYLLAKMTIWKCNYKRQKIVEKLILEESLDLVMIKLEDENTKRSFCLILRGYSPAEIPEELGISKKAVERFKYDILEILTLEINVTNNRFR